jgi:hypothetical protein
MFIIEPYADRIVVTCVHFQTSKAGFEQVFLEQVYEFSVL